MGTICYSKKNYQDDIYLSTCDSEESEIEWCDDCDEIKKGSSFYCQHCTSVFKRGLTIIPEDTKD